MKGRRFGFITGKLLLFFVTLLVTQKLYSNPEGGTVVSGDATINQSPGHTDINQSSQNAIINWNRFNIRDGETTNFNQPGNGITLNRIDPRQGVSEIFGHLNATGRVILINQAGIFFGTTAMVNVGSLIASTADITDQNFLSGKYTFDKTSQYHGTIINQGRIIANHGLIALIGSNITNQGYIQANMGSVVLASGDKFTIDLNGDGLISFSVDAASSGSGVDHDGNRMHDGINNSGTVVADGGTVLMTARAAEGVVDNAINMSGVLQARSVSQQQGQIILSANGNVKVSGRIDVSGKEKNARGGKVKIFAKKVELTSSSEIDASGDIKGGDIIIAGDSSSEASKYLDDVVSKQNATIFSAADIINLAGKIDVSATGEKSQGGNAIILAKKIETEATSTIKATGTQGGNVILTGSMTIDTDGYLNNLLENPKATTFTAAEVINLAGHIDASGVGNASQGGAAVVLGKNIHTTTTSTIETKGTQGGNVVLAAGITFNSNGYLQDLIQNPNSTTFAAADLINLEGKIDASGQGQSSSGGKVKVLADQIHLASSAKVIANGDNQGGEILIGGNTHGQGVEPNAKNVTVDQDALLEANALVAGDGGKIIVWSDGITEFNGTINARGGSQGGNGGFVETSGHVLKISNPKIDLSAQHGKTGTWLLDPTNIVIQDGGQTNTSFNGTTFTPTGNDSVIDVNVLEASLNTANIVITTNSSGSQQGNITINAPINWSSSNTLTLNANNNIIINFFGRFSAISSQNGNLILNAGNLIALNGNVAVGGIQLQNGTFFTQNPLFANLLEQANPIYMNDKDPLVALANDSGRQLEKIIAQNKEAKKIAQEQKSMDIVQIASTKIVCNKTNKTTCDSLDIMTQ